MDKTKNILLAGGIAIMFPVLVLFSVLTIFPSDNSEPSSQPVYPDYPTYPIQPTCSYDYQQYPDEPMDEAYQLSRDDCLQQEVLYQQELDSYDSQVQQYESQIAAYDKAVREQEHKYTFNRASLAIVLSVIAIAATIAIRHIKELAAGLVIGATFSLIVSISYLISAMGVDNVRTLPTVLVSISFLVLSGVLYLLETNVPKNINTPLITGGGKNLQPKPALMTPKKTTPPEASTEQPPAQGA